MGARLRAELAGVVDSSRPWSLVDYPMHLNAGDSALYLGTLAMSSVVAAGMSTVSDRQSWSPRALPVDSTVVIQAGGNWGGLYPTHHQLRLQVLREVRDRPVLQLPQSIEYASETAREDLRRAVGEHPAFTLLVRDRRSLERARADYDCEIRLVPDMAFGLGTLRRAAPRTSVVVQARLDREAASAVTDRPSFDWLTAPPWSASALALRGAVAANRIQRKTQKAAVPASRAMEVLARASVGRARRLLSRGEFVITDRLHGHILCVLLGIPHVMVNDKFGKIAALQDSWTAGFAGAEFASGWSEADEALSRLQRRLAELPGPAD